MSPATNRRVAAKTRSVWILVIALSLSITLTQQKWVGGMSIYHPDLRADREMLHDAVLRNRLPDSVSTWREAGANGLNIRLLTVWAAEALHRHAGISVHRSYVFIETAALAAICLLLFAFLEPLTGWPFAMTSLLYWGCVLPLTYVNHLFHPWDKPSIAMWLLALICTRQRRWWWLAAVLIVGMATKYDLLLFPVLVFLAYRKDEPSRVLVPRVLAFLALTFCTYWVLRWLAPGGMEPRSLVAQAQENLVALRDYVYFYPPLLAMGLPAILAGIGWRAADQFSRACVQLAVILTAILILQTNFIEVRAEVPLLLLLLPAASYGLKHLLAPDEPAVAVANG